MPIFAREKNMTVSRLASLAIAVYDVDVKNICTHMMDTQPQLVTSSYLSIMFMEYNYYLVFLLIWHIC